MIGAILVAAAVDALIGEPPDRLHPVAALGAVIDRLDRAWPAPRLAGVVSVVLIVGLAAGVAGGLTHLASAVATPLGVLVAGLALGISISRRRLLAVASDCLRAVESGREADLAALVGRPTADLSADHRRSAIAESLAENLADGLCGPLAGFLIGAIHSPAAAVAGTAAVTAIDALDATIGYPDRPLGWASARTDDLVAALPARLAAVAIAAVALDPGALWRARRTARRPASPNAGWPMATLAAVLDGAFEKPGAYRVGSGSLPDAVAVERAIVVVDRAAWLSIAVAAIVALGLDSGLPGGLA